MGTILSHALGAAAAKTRCMQVMDNNAPPAARVRPYNERSVIMDVRCAVPGLPQGAISIPADNLTGVDQSMTWTAVDGRSYVLLDAYLSDYTRIIPFNAKSPWAGTAREATAWKEINPFPTFFVHQDGSYGVPITAGQEAFNALLNARSPFDRPRTSLKVRLDGWPGYSHIPDTQIQYSNTPNCGRVQIDVGKIGYKVAKAVRSALKNSDSQWAPDCGPFADSRYRVGPGMYGIKESDIILLGVIFVSPGAVLPLLQLRRDVNTTNSPPLDFWRDRNAQWLFHAN